MNRPRAAFGLRLLITFFSIVAVTATSVAVEKKLLARSSKLNLEVYVIAHQDKWCSPVVTVNVYAKETSVYDTGDFESLVPKLGSLVESQCPNVLELLLQGFDAKGGLQILNAVAIAKDGWALQVLK